MSSSRLLQHAWSLVLALGVGCAPSTDEATSASSQEAVDGRALELSTSEASGFFSYETFSEKTFQMVPADEPSTPTTCKLTYSTGNLADPSNPVLGIFLDVGDSNGNGDHAKFNFAGMPEGSTGNHPTKRIEVLAAFKQPIQDGSTLTERAEFGSTIAIDSVTYAAGKLIVQRKHETSDEIDEMTITTTPNLETVSEVHYTRKTAKADLTDVVCKTLKPGA